MAYILFPFTAKHATQDKASSMQGYFDNSAWLKVENGHNFVAVRINKSETVTSLQNNFRHWFNKMLPYFQRMKKNQ